MKTLPKKEKNNTKKEYAKRYLLKYIKELKVHFDLSENHIKSILKDIYYSKTVFYHIFKRVKKFFRKKQ